MTRITNDELKNSRGNLSRCGNREEAAFKRKNIKFKILLEGQKLRTDRTERTTEKEQ